MASSRGDSASDLFLPRPVRLWEQGRFRSERLITTHDFDNIDDDFDDISEAARDAETGKTVKGRPAHELSHCSSKGARP